MHGLEQSQALTVAAQNLSTALARQREVAVEVAKAPAHRKSSLVERAQTAAHEVGVARAVYRAAYTAYTNPFDTQKTFS